MKVSVKFRKDYEGEIEGRRVSYRAKDIVEMEIGEAKTLFEKKIVLAGPQTTKPISMWK